MAILSAIIGIYLLITIIFIIIIVDKIEDAIFDPPTETPPFFYTEP